MLSGSSERAWRRNQRYEAISEGSLDEQLAHLASPQVAALAHYDGWSLFRDGEQGLRAALDAAPAYVRERPLWLTDGLAVEV